MCLGDAPTILFYSFFIYFASAFCKYAFLPQIKKNCRDLLRSKVVKVACLFFNHCTQGGSGISGFTFVNFVLSAASVAANLGKHTYYSCHSLNMPPHGRLLKVVISVINI